MTSQQQATYEQRMSALLDKMEQRFGRLEKLASQSPEEQGAKAGVDSARDDDGKTFKKYEKQLQNSRFAAAFFPSRKHAQLAIRRFSMGMPQRRLA